MELGFWGHLWKDSEARLRLQQRIPEVCVFHGCRLDGWYHTNSNGFVVRRNQFVNSQALVECFSAPSAHSGQGPKTPVAILRRPTAICNPDVGGAPAKQVPSAEVITAEGLVSLMQALDQGCLPHGIRKNDVWSLQAFIQPIDNVRAISVYSCDVMAVERSDVFGRQFSKVYNAESDITEQTPEDVAADRCLPIPPKRRASLEARTLSVVRFLSRFYSQDFEGLVLEFIFDASERPILHACWASSVFGNEPRRKIRDEPRREIRPRSSSPSRIPKVFPVPAVEPDSAVDLQENAQDMASGQGIEHTVSPDGCDATGSVSKTSKVETNPGTSPRSISGDILRECVLLLEV